jgi:hypothetical protein
MFLGHRPAQELCGRHQGLERRLSCSDRSLMSLALLLLSSSLLGASAATADCDQLLGDTQAAALALDYQAFDQTPGQGFRVLAEARCPRQGADLIERYIEHTGASQHSLRWHIAQLRGEAGQTDAARAAAMASLRVDEGIDAPFRWNAHVRAYVGFLDGDRAAFDAALAELDDHAAAHQGNVMNAGFWHRLAPHFELGYSGALIAAMAK